MTFYSQTWLSPKAFIGYGSRHKPWLVVKINANGEDKVNDFRLWRDAISFAVHKNRMEKKKLKSENFKRRREGLEPITREHFDTYLVKRWNVKGSVP